MEKFKVASLTKAIGNERSYPSVRVAVAAFVQQQEEAT
jgi:hypothetical protein